MRARAVVASVYNVVSGSRTHKLAWWGLAAALVVLIATAGGVLRWSVPLAALVTGTAAAAARWASASGGERTAVARERALPRVAWPLLLAAGFTALALVPLPREVMAWLAPGKASLLQANAAALGVRPAAWYAASYDPSLSWLFLSKALLGVVVAVVGARLASSGHGRANVAWLIVGAVTAVVVAAWINTLLAPGWLWGLWRSPVDAAITGPLINLNHLAGVCALVAPVALALAVRSPLGKRRWGGMIFVALVATVLATGSRGGLLGLGVALAVGVPMVFAAEAPRLRRVRRARWMGMALAAVGALTVWAVASRSMSHEVKETSVAELSQPGSKFAAWRASAGLVAAAPWTGVGGGAFEVAFSQYATEAGVRYSHPENLAVQAVAELGWLGGSAVIAAWLWMMIAGFRHAKASSLRGAAWAGLLGLLVHEQFDFSLEMPLVMALAVLCGVLAVPVRARRRDQAREVTGGARVAGGAYGVLGLSGYVVVAFAVAIYARPPSADIMAADAAASEAADATARLVSQTAALSALVAKHPSDDATWTRLGQALVAQRDARAFRVLARAVALGPTNAQAHIALGIGMSRSSARSQAAVEFAAALRLSRDVSLVAVVEAALPSPAEAARALPADRADVAFWLRELGRTERRALAQAYARRVGELYPGAADIQLTVAQTLMTTDPSAALRSARVAEALAPSVDSAVALAYALVQNQTLGAAFTYIRNPALDRREGGEALALEFARLGVALAWVEQAEPVYAETNLAAAAPVIEAALAASEPRLRTLEERRAWLTFAARWQDLQGNEAQAAALRAKAAGM